ncbi:MAG: hypothetical protein EBR55_09685 [Chitinophagia bacterium]|nr:hypothetical protein [Chitinophagia bacterium]
MKRILFLNFLCCVLVSVTSFAQVGVGTTSPNASAILEVSSTNKGVLLPSVNLTSNTMDLDGNSSTVQPVGMLVYNSGNVLTKGYCYWSGTEWRSITNSSLAQGTLGAIQCNAVSINPESYTAGTAYSGTMSHLRIGYLIIRNYGYANSNESNDYNFSYKYWWKNLFRSCRLWYWYSTW